MGEVIGRILATVAIWIVILPILLLLATPVFLVAACFSSDGYSACLRRNYRSVAHYWLHAATNVH